MPINYTVLATSALGFSLAMAWNDAVSKTVGLVVPRTDGASAARSAIAYAAVMTLMVVVIAALANHAQRVTQHFFQAGREGATVRPASLAKKPDCAECLRHCGVGALVGI